METVQPPIWECLSIASTFVLTYYIFGPFAKMKHIHNILFSLMMSYSTYMDIHEIMESMSYVDPSWLKIDIVSAYFYYSYIAYWYYIHWVTSSNSQRLINLTCTIGCISLHLSGIFNILYAVLLHGAYGHAHFIHSVLDYLKEEGVINSLTYKRWYSLTYNYLIIPIMFGTYLLLGYVIYENIHQPNLFDWLRIDVGMYALCLNLLYVMYDAYIVTVDYGYNRALFRIDLDRFEEV